MGDRECPNCLEEELVEKSLRTWECLHCGEVFDEEFLDASEDEE